MESEAKLGFTDQIKRFTDQAKEALTAVSSLDEEVLGYEFDANDEASIQAAIDRGAAQVDQTLAPYDGNPMVGKVAAEVKVRLADMVRARATELRRSGA